MKQERAFTVGRRFESFRSDYSQETRREPVQPLVSQDCEEGLRDAASNRFVHGVGGKHVDLIVGGDRSNRSAQIMPLRQMVRHRFLVPIIAGSNPAGAVPPWLSWQSNRLVSGRLWVQIPPAA